MFRLLRRLLTLGTCAALAGAAFVLVRSGDAEYTAREWLHGERYAAYDAMIREISEKRGLDPFLVKAMIWRESKFQPSKVGTSGERGLMQVGEAAAKDWARAMKIETFAPTDLFDPKNNIEAGAWYLSKALEHWKERNDPIPFMLAEYNAGKKRVDRWIARSGRGAEVSAAEFLAQMDFPTTKQYIEDIVARRDFYRRRNRL